METVKKQRGRPQKTAKISDSVMALNRDSEEKNMDLGKIIKENIIGSIGDTIEKNETPKLTKNAEKKASKFYFDGKSLHLTMSQKDATSIKIKLPVICLKLE